MTYFGGFCDPNSNCIIGKYCFDVYESVTDVSVGFAAAILDIGAPQRDKAP